MKIQDCLHLYKGCFGKVKVFYGALHGTQLIDCQLVGVVEDRVHVKCFDKDGKAWDGILQAPIEDFTPSFRPLSDMTVAEKVYCHIEYAMDFKITGDDHFCYETHGNLDCFSKCVFYLLSKGFDLSGLIGAGLAIEKAKEATL